MLGVTKRNLPARPVWERLWSKVDRSGGRDACWPWTGAVSGKRRSGYAKISVRMPTGRHRLVPAHWLVYTFCIGAVPPGVRVLHTCRMRTCMQPKHLVLSEHVSDRTLIEAGTWRSRRVSGARNGRARLTEDDVRAIRRRRANGELLISLSQRFQVSQSQISAICRGLTWKEVA